MKVWRLKRSGRKVNHTSNGESSINRRVRSAMIVIKRNVLSSETFDESGKTGKFGDFNATVEK